jgi:uncharacterized protein (TIGR02001 family)
VTEISLILIINQLASRYGFGEKFMKSLQKTAIAGSLLLVTAVAVAEDKSPVVGNVAFTNDYVWRGWSQTAEDPAVQGGLDYAHPGGFYLGVWGSNVDFEDLATDGAHLEVDVYGGYKFKAGSLDMDVGALHYAYPGAAGSLDYDWTEVYAGVGVGGFGAKLWYTNDYTGTSDEGAYYLEANYGMELGQGFGLGLHVGRSDGDFFDGGLDQTDYSVSLSKTFGGVGFKLSFMDTDTDAEIKSGPFANDGRVVLTVSKSM